jgi:sialate O-acetylesterase
MHKQFLIVSIFATIALGTQAKVTLPNLISDNMILQQNSDARLWGTDTPGKTVKVSASWSDNTYSTKVDKDGKWMVKIKTPAAGFAPYSITFDDGEKSTVNGVLSGEVWVCAGQSNMEMPVKGFGNCPVQDYNKVVLDAVNSKGVHFVKIPSVMSETPLDNAQCEWKICDPTTVGEASATGYFFARMVSRALQIPIGLIEANKGGTRVESWLNRDNLTKYTKEDLNINHIKKNFKWDYHYPLLWGNGTFHPILNYTVKGIIFYQGCSNVGDPGDQYSQRLALLVKQWREEFGLGEIPFYFVQIAPYYYDNDVNAISGAKLREQQFKASQIIPNSAIVGTNDAVYPYETQQIHPCQKEKVGERLGFLALNKQYGMKQLIADAPTYKSMKISNDTVYVQLDNLADGISRYEDMQGFELAGEDKVFHKANAYYYWTQGIIITCPEVKKPVAVRYCFRNFQLGNVANQGGLPLFPFRTDNW